MPARFALCFIFSRAMLPRPSLPNSVFFYEILNSPDRACHLAKQVRNFEFNLRPQIFSAIVWLAIPA